ncbi:MAG TPA: helix-turn-helix domain-containing protein, partial [Gemmataceae bacterium]|nr:helix-turn-helix domain-containing protein [Gemmataceae bacterium]
ALYYRLGVFTIHLPPLRDRQDDLPVLVQHFLRRFNRELSRDVREVSPEAMARLRAYPWPGNLRELQSVLKQALLRATGSVLLPAVLPELTTEPPPTSAETPTGPSDREVFIRKRLAEGSEELYDEAHRELDRVLLPLVMEYTRGNQFQAAKILGVARQTLRNRLRELHITPRFTEGTEDDAD